MRPIFAFGASLYAAITIAQVKKEIVGRVRLPELIKAIERDASAIVDLMDDYEGNQDQIGVALAKCEPHLKTVVSSVPRARPKAKVIVRLMKDYSTEWILLRANRNRRSEAWKIYAQLLGLVEELREANADQRITG